MTTEMSFAAVNILVICYEYIITKFSFSLFRFFMPLTSVINFFYISICNNW